MIKIIMGLLLILLCLAGTCSTAVFAEEPADTWLGKWSAKSIYKETSRVWEWWFEVSRNEKGYQIQTHTEGPDKTEILHISPNKLEFLFNDALGTHITLTMTDNNTISGKIHQPNNSGLPHGREEGHRVAPPAEDKKIAQLDENKGWVEYGIGDCSGRDAGASEGTVPDDAKAKEGYIAVCWDGGKYENGNSPGRAWCTYKKIAPDECTGGGNAGVMYRAGKEKSPATACEQPKVAFLQTEGTGLTPVGPEGVRYGAVFVVEVDCGSSQNARTRQLTLEWDGDQLVLDLTRQSDGRVYRSEKLFLMPPKEKADDRR